MLQDFQYLLQLQEIDLKIHEQVLAKRELPETVRCLEETVETAGVAKEKARAQAEEAEKGIHDLDEQVSGAQAGLEKSMERLNAIKTNREYDAVHAEIENQKNIIQTSEVRKKKLSDEAAGMKAAADAAASEYDRIRSENEPKVLELKARIASIDSVIAGIEKERAGVAALITKSTIRTYELIKDRRKNACVVSRVNEERTCSVCHKVLEQQVMSEIKRSAKLLMCQSCGSIFVWTGKRTLQDKKQ